MSLSYKHWIRPDRVEPSSRDFSSVNQAIESDRGRIIFSSPFRRLQNKAQVFPLEGNAAVRSRLTHSLEVAHIGRYIAQEVLNQLRAIGEFDITDLRDQEQAFITLVENACLLHDIGNPPFGHFGESAIREWFRDTGFEVFKQATTTASSEAESYRDDKFKDFTEFDGNPQGFRIITKLQGEDGKTGLNLTLSQLASFLKYVALPQQIDSNYRLKKKAGFFNTELDVIQKIRTTFNLTSSQRFPLASLMEAADDIAYCLSDIEDGIEKGLISFDKFVAETKKAADPDPKDDDETAKIKAQIKAEVNNLLTASDTGRISDFLSIRTKIFNNAVKHVAEQYVKHHEQICKGEHIELIMKNSALELIFNTIRKKVAREIYSSCDAEHIELAGHATVFGLLEKFSALLKLSKEDFTEVINDNVKHCKDNGLEIEIRLAHMLPKVAIKAYTTATPSSASRIEEWHNRAHLILDYLCGMTDNFSLKTFRLLSGIKISNE